MKVENRKAKFRYHILEKYEAGIVLKGGEVKAIREGKVSLQESYCKIIKGEIFVINMHIGEYTRGYEKIPPKRNRKLLLHRREINRLMGKVEEKGFTIIPLSLYFNSKGIAKMMIGVAKGKKKRDKREKIRKKDLEKELKTKLKK